MGVSSAWLAAHSTVPSIARRAASFAGRPGVGARSKQFAKQSRVPSENRETNPKPTQTSKRECGLGYKPGQNRKPGP
jgi:hypothetical protein